MFSFFFLFSNSLMSFLSLSDWINLDLNFIWNRIWIIINSTFLSKFLESDQMVPTKLIKSAVNLNKKFKFDWKSLKRDQKDRLFRLNLTFLIKIDFSDLLIDFKLIFFNLLIEMWSILIEFNRKRDGKWSTLIKNRSKLQSSTRSSTRNRICIEIVIQIWNPNSNRRQRLDLRWQISQA